MTLVVGCLQLDYPPGESAPERVERVANLLDAAPAADLLVLPELWDVSYFAFDDYEAFAAPIGSGPATRVTAVAASRHCVIVAGSVLERDGDQLFNTTLVVGPDGGVLGSYRKTHLFAHGSREAALLTPGRAVSVVHTPLGRIGLATCFDLRFPGQFASMRDGGADFFAVPAAWPLARVEHWRVLVRARAIETQTPVIAVNGVGPCGPVELGGESTVASARGDVQTGALVPGWFTAEVDPADTESWRREFPIADAVVVDGSTAGRAQRDANSPTSEPR